MFDVRSFGMTDIGRRRQQNEDAFLRNDEVRLFVVADGMGGHAAGEIASAEAVDTIYGMFKRGLPALGSEDEPLTDDTISAARRLIEGAIQAATYMIFAMGEADSGRSGMGTTISAAFIFKNVLVTGQVGDSRIYRVRGGRVLQLTEDHTLVGWQLKQGLISEDEARLSPHRNVITRSVGGRDYVEVDTGVVEVRAGDRFLLCSDGLHGYLEEPEIPDLVALGGNAAAQGFIDMANDRGGSDNITCILVEVD
ncbi:MAG TPA: serine/threonine-protein phosphatase [Sorangium sp.]|nr:serine/threonine-protein phosphatase [Sorangium sp.]